MIVALLSDRDAQRLIRALTDKAHRCLADHGVTVPDEILEGVIGTTVIDTDLVEGGFLTVADYEGRNATVVHLPRRG